MSQIKPQHLAVAAAAGAAAVLAYTAARAVGPATMPLKPVTELQPPARDFQAHLATAAELQSAPVRLPHRYPAQTCPGITQTIHQGFTPLYALPDPQIAALPAAQPW